MPQWPKQTIILIEKNRVKKWSGSNLTNLTSRSATVWALRMPFGLCNAFATFGNSDGGLYFRPEAGFLSSSLVLL